VNAAPDSENREELVAALNAEPELLPAGEQEPVVTVNGKPELILPNDNTRFIECAKHCFEHLAHSEDFFLQGGVVVELVDTGQGKQLREVKPDAFRSRLEEHFELRAANRDGNRRVLTQKLCSKDSAIALLKSSEIRRLPPIQRVLTNPVFVENDDGELKVLNQGYHPENGGTYVLSGTEITETICIEEAVATLRGLFSDFNFVTQSDESRCIAGLISPALRFGGLLRANFPIDLCEADLSQTGKSYRTEIISEIYGELPYFITSSERGKGVGSLSEDISGAVMSGKGIIIFDNLRGVLDSTLLESAIREGRMIQARVPHIEGKQLATDHIIWMATSNQAQATADLANRSVITRLRKQKGGYEFKRYNGLSVLDYVKKERAYILSCIFAVVRDYQARAGA
jgi:hypothetical protein